MSSPNNRLAQFQKPSNSSKMLRKRRKSRQTWVATESMDPRKNEKMLGQDDNATKASKNVKPNQLKPIDVKKNEKKKKEFKPKQQPTKLTTPRGKNTENQTKWKRGKKSPRLQKVQNMSSKDEKKETSLERKHSKGGRKKSIQKVSDEQKYNRDFLLDLAPVYREVEPVVQQQLSSLGIWAQRQRKKSLVLTTLRNENDRKSGTWGRPAVDEDISLSTLHSLFHSNRTTIKLSYLRNYLKEQREQRDKKMREDNGLQRRPPAPRTVYVRRDPSAMALSPSHRHLMNIGNDDDDRGKDRDSLLYNLHSVSEDSRHYVSNDSTEDVTFANAAALAASCAARQDPKNLGYDTERQKDAGNDHDDDDDDALNLHTGFIDPQFQLLSPASKTRALDKKYVELQREKQKMDDDRQSLRKKLEESFNDTTARLNDQLKVVFEENSDITSRLNTMKRKNEKLQARLSLIGEKNLELMEELECYKMGKKEEQQEGRRHSKDSEERQPIFPSDEVRHPSAERHTMRQPERSLPTRDIHQSDQSIHEDIHSLSMSNRQNEDQMHTSALGETQPQHMDPSHQQSERVNNPQMINFSQMPPLPMQPPHYFYDAPPGGTVPAQLNMTNTPFQGMGGMGSMPFPPVMFPPPPFTPYPIMPTLNGELLPICVTFYGSRHIQNQLDSGEDPNFFSKFFNEVKDRAYEVMTNKFGRFAFEKMLNKCNDEERTILLRNLMPTLSTAACDVHGSFGTQVLVKSLTRDEQIKMVADALKVNILTLITDYKGHYLVIVLIQKFHYEDFQWIDQAVAENSQMIATNHQGLQVMKALFKNRTTEQILHLLQIIAEQTMKLVEDQYGNYIIQTALTKNFDCDGYPHFEKVVHDCQERMLKKMENNFRHLAQQKFSSNVVELCLKEAAFDRWKNVIINELLAHPPVAVKDLINDRYGNYVLQTALAEAHPRQVTLIAERITPHFSCFRVNIRAKWAKLVKAARERTGT